MNRPRVTVIAFAPIREDGRVLRQIHSLAKRCQVSVVGYGPLQEAESDRISMHSIPLPEAFIARNLRDVPKLALGRLLPEVGYERWYWDRRDHQAALTATLASKPELILANDWDGLPVAARAAEQCGAKIALDLHEYGPLQFNQRRAWMQLVAPMIRHFLRKHAGSVSGFMTVNQSIADQYQKDFGFLPSVVMNVPEFGVAPEFHPTDPDKIQLVHHGVPVPDRRLEVMIEALALARPCYQLHFMLVDRNPKYVAQLRELAARIAPGRVSFDAAVAPGKIVETIARFDLGIFVLAPHGFNARMALPNKLFEFMAAGLAVCIGPSMEMARIVTQYQCGVVAESFEPEACATVLNALTPEIIDAMKRRSIAARAELTAASQAERVWQIVERALSA